MRRAFGLLLVLVGPPALLSASCSDEKSARLPPPLPVPQAQPEEPPAAQPEGEAEPAPSPTSQSKAKPPAARQPSTPKAGRNTKSSPAPTPPAKPPATAKAPAVAPAPVAKAPAPAPSAPAKSAPVKSSRVTIPQLPHVRVEVPEGLQRDLDADPRMQSWLERVFTIIDGCHAQNGRALGTIEAQITMHENERPDADLRSLPPALSSVVACATGGLMRTKMPLFTGREGTRYAVRIRFQ